MQLGVNVEVSSICGGGAKSPLWRKIIADVLNIKLLQTENDEGPALGGAMLASVAAGVYKDVGEAIKAIVKPVTETLPDAEDVAKYDERYKEFKQLYPALKGFFNR